MTDFVSILYGHRGGNSLPSSRQRTTVHPFIARETHAPSSLYQLFDSHYETVKAVWEERFERQYGFWRGHWDSAVATYQDCGLFESGFARVRCPSCKFEFLVAFSCRCRGLCSVVVARSEPRFSPSCSNTGFSRMCLTLNGCSRSRKC